MRGRSSRSGSKGGIEIEKTKEEPQLSGAYIRSLVKQLTSSRSSKDPMKNPSDLDREGLIPPAHQNLTKLGHQVLLTMTEGQGSHQPQQQQHKKQVRRRLHTTRPYQERLLNMAEARREIVTALKFHRAAMKQQANDDQHQPPLPLSPPSQQQAQLGEKSKSRRNPRIYPSSSGNSNFPNISNGSSNSQNPINYYWPVASQMGPYPPPVVTTENLNYLTLPNQTLGLNLNIQEFHNLDSTLYHNPTSIFSSSLSPSSTSPSPTTLYRGNDHEHVPNHTPTTILQEGIDNGIGLGLHPAMDEEEMAEIRSIGEQHEMEWNDTMNLATSARWFKFFKNNNTEIEPSDQEDKGKDDEDDGYQCHHPFDEVFQFPSSPCSNANDFFNNHFFDDSYLQDPALPCMDIGEIEGMDGEWLA